MFCVEVLRFTVEKKWQKDTLYMLNYVKKTHHTILTLLEFLIIEWPSGSSWNLAMKTKPETKTYLTLFNQRTFDSLWQTVSARQAVPPFIVATSSPVSPLQALKVVFLWVSRCLREPPKWTKNNITPEDGDPKVLLNPYSETWNNFKLKSSLPPQAGLQVSYICDNRSCIALSCVIFSA